jgi:hypothetical protein
MSASFEAGVLLGGKPEVDSAPTHFNRVLKRLLALKVAPGFPTPGQLPNFVRAGKSKPPRQRGFQVRLQKLAMPPALVAHKVQVDGMRGFRVPRHALSIGEEKAKIPVETSSLQNPQKISEI